MSHRSLFVNPIRRSRRRGIQRKLKDTHLSPLNWLWSFASDRSGSRRDTCRCRRPLPLCGRRRVRPVSCPAWSTPDSRTPCRPTIVRRYQNPDPSHQRCNHTRNVLLTDSLYRISNVSRSRTFSHSDHVRTTDDRSIKIPFADVKVKERENL